MENKIIQFPEGTNKVIIDTEKVMPDIYKAITNFRQHMCGPGRKDSPDCYAVVESIDWDNDSLTLTPQGKDYLTNLVKDYVKEDIENIWVSPENSDNIYCICSLDCVTENYAYEFECYYYRYGDEPYTFRRIISRKENKSIYPNREKYTATIKDCIELSAPIAKCSEDNIMAVKMMKAIQKKFDEASDKYWQMDEEAYDKIRSTINDDLFDVI